MHWIADWSRLTLIITVSKCAVGLSGANTMLIKRSRRRERLTQKSLHYNFREISKRRRRMKWLPGRASGITFFRWDLPGYSSVPASKASTPSSFESNYDFQKADSVIEYYASGNRFPALRKRKRGKRDRERKRDEDSINLSINFKSFS